MVEKQELIGARGYSENDLYPSEIRFTNGFNVCLACSEDGQHYLQVKDLLAGPVGALSRFALKNGAATLDC